MEDKAFENVLRSLGIDRVINLCMQYRYDNSLLEVEIKKWKYEAHKACLQMEEYQQEKWDLQNKLASNTKQVCEKIMNRAETANALQSVRDGTVSLSVLRYILEQVVKGDSNGSN